MVKKLNPRQEKFCRLYATTKEFFGNGVQAYIEAYNPNQSKRNWYKNAKAAAHENLTKPYLCDRINELLESEGFNNEFVDKQTLFLITQHADFNSKIRAIQEYNKLRKRVSDKDDAGIILVMGNKWNQLKKIKKEKE